MTEELQLLKDIAGRLNGAGIEYMMTGSMALAFYANPRMTRDIDIIIHVGPNDAEAIVDLFRNDFYIDPGTVQQAIQNHGMFNAIHNDTVIKVDFIVRKQDEYRVEEFSRRQTVEIDTVPISIVSPEDLLLSKLVWAKSAGSEMQLRDAHHLLLGVENIDYQYLSYWAQRLQVSNLLNKAQSNV